MTTQNDFEIFLATAPGLETALRLEAQARRFKKAKAVPGGVTIKGGWKDVWRANLELRGANRIIAQIGAFRAFHLAQLDKRARRVTWSEVLRPELPVRVEATCSKSRIYHSGAAAQRIERAINETLGCPIVEDADITVRARIEDDLVTIGIDTSGDLLHRRGYKEAVNKAPMRETMASLFLRLSGYEGKEPVLDPMCGSGTFVIEAAEMAAGLKPGRSRRFAFEQLATFDATAWQLMREAALKHGDAVSAASGLKFHGSDRDAGAIAMSRANAERAGVSGITEFTQRAVSEIAPPVGPPGLVICNPPYGTRLGEKTKLQPLYRSLGQTLMARFAGWRVALITSEAGLARATGLAFNPPSAPVAHGGLRVTLFLTGPLK